MRIVIIVLDGVGIGALPDAGKYGDAGANTLRHCAEAVGGLSLPNLERLGLGNLGKFKGIKQVPHSLASFAKMAEKSAGKDTVSGHWEISGLVQSAPFPTYPNGFPPEIIKAFTRAIGKKGVLWNKTASGTDLIKELGDKHLKTGWPIVYTSADSVFQIAAHQEVAPLAELYAMCKTAREIMTGRHRVARVIARPFGGPPGNFERVPGRQDFSVPPPQATLLNKMQDAGLITVGIGKIGDIFSGSGLDKIIHTFGNAEGIAQTAATLEHLEPDLVFTNLVDFDTLYGHRNDPQGFAQALIEFDKKLPEIMEAMLLEDILVITADHGCDPTGPGTDHTREYVPLLIFGGLLIGGIDLGTRTSFADLGQTIAEAHGLRPLPHGTSFWKQISKEAQGIASFT